LGREEAKSQRSPRDQEHRAGISRRDPQSCERALEVGKHEALRLLRLAPHREIIVDSKSIGCAK